MDDLFSSSPNSPARRSVLLAGGAALGTYALGAFGKWSDWPSKPVRIVAGQAPGSSNDAMGRALADFLSQKLGVPVIVENKPGGVGMIAAEAVARSAPDGHTLLFPLYSQMAQGPVLLRRPPVNPDTALVPIGAMGVGPAPVVVNKNFPVKTLDELISYAKKKPVNVGNYAIGSGWHLMLNQLMNETGAQFNIANYKGTGAMLVDLYAGTIDVGAGSLAGLGPGIQKGMVRPIVLLLGSRSSRLPGVPTWADAGFNGPAFELPEYNMLYAPTGTPTAIVDRLAGLMRISVTESPKVKAVRDMLAADDHPLIGEVLRNMMERTLPTYRNLTRNLNISVD